MMIPPREVSPGDKISATRWNALIRYLRAITPKPGSGLKATFSPNGTILRAEVPPLSRTVKAISGRFALVSCARQEDGSIELEFANPIYRCGARSYRLLPQNDEPNVSFTVEAAPAIVALVVRVMDDEPSAYFASFGDFSILQAAEGDPSQVVLPLYTFDDSGALVCDWRTGPEAIQFEFDR